MPPAHDEQGGTQVVQPGYLGVLHELLLALVDLHEFWLHAGVEGEVPGLVLLGHEGVLGLAPEPHVVVPGEHLLPINKPQQGSGVAVCPCILPELPVRPVKLQFRQLALISLLHPPTPLRLQVPLIGVSAKM